MTPAIFTIGVQDSIEKLDIKLQTAIGLVISELFVKPFSKKCGLSKKGPKNLACQAIGMIAL